MAWSARLKYANSPDVSAITTLSESSEQLVRSLGDSFALVEATSGAGARNGFGDSAPDHFGFPRWPGLVYKAPGAGTDIQVGVSQWRRYRSTTGGLGAPPYRSSHESEYPRFVDRQEPWCVVPDRHSRDRHGPSRLLRDGPHCVSGPSPSLNRCLQRGTVLAPTCGSLRNTSAVGGCLRDRLADPPVPTRILKGSGEGRIEHVTCEPDTVG